MIFIDSITIKESVDYPTWVDTMEEALKTYVSSGHYTPRRMHLDHGADTFLLMPSITDNYWATKLVSFCPGNRNLGKPSIYGTIILNDSKTGEPLAVMDGSMITAMRTAALSAAGIRNLAPPSATSLGIVGTGSQGIYQALFACSVLPITRITAFDSHKGNLEKFSAGVKDRYPDIDVVYARDSGEVALQSEVVITATNSATPVFEDIKELFTGRLFVGIGSYKPDCMEFPEQLFRQLDEIFVDTPDAKRESGDLFTTIGSHWIADDKVYPLGHVLTGEIQVSENPTKLFKTVGNAIFDLFAAKLIYENYRTKNL